MNLVSSLLGESDIKQNPNYTHTLLLEKRRATNLPDQSYDLNGDGIVDQKDYAIARQFDANKNNKLTPEERAKAMEAITKGYEKQFVYVSAEVANHHRILQKRGKIIIADDFSPLINTYPQHPISETDPMTKTLTQTL